MREKYKKAILFIGGFILAAVLFLAFFMFSQNDWENAEISSSASQDVGLESDDSQNVGITSDDSGGGGESGELNGDSGSGSGSNGDGLGGGGGGEPEEWSWFRIKSDVSQLIYLRIYSEGDYTGGIYDEETLSAFKPAPTYDYGDSLNPLYYYAKNLQYSGFMTSNVEIELVKESRYLLPYYTTKEMKDDVSLSPTNYKLQYVTYDYLSGLGAGVNADPALSAQESLYAEYVKNTYLTIDPKLQAQLLSLAEENGIEETSKTLISDVAYYISHAAAYDLAAEEAPEGEDMILYFLTQSKTGVCRHYAAAATMLYRAYGIPARYTVGYAVYTDSGNWVEYSGAGHAWVEIYLDGYGWVAVEVTGSPADPDDGTDDGTGDGSGDGSGEAPGDGDEKWTTESLDTTPSQSEKEEVFSVYSDTDGSVYLRLYSVGEYTGNGFTNAQRYFGGTINPLSYMARTLAANGYDYHELRLEKLQNVGFLTPYYMEVSLGSDVQVSSSYAAYTAPFILYSYQQMGTEQLQPITDEAFVVEEKAYRQFAYEQYTLIDTAYAEQLLAIAKSNGISAESVTLIEDIANYVQSTAVYNLNFSPFPKGEDMILYFLTEGKEGICQHYAAAATMLYRAFGIPARYTVGYLVETEADVWKTVDSHQSHAWVEVYLDGLGWVAVEVTGEDLSVVTPVEPKFTVHIRTQSTTKEYDGEPLSRTDIQVTGIPFGYTWQIKEYTGAKKVGSYANRVWIEVFDGEGNGVPIEQIMDCGTLTVTPRALKVTTFGSKTYGNEETVLTNRYYKTEGLVAGQRISLFVTGQQVGVGGSQNTVDVNSFTVYDAHGNDVTGNYDISFEYGWLYVYPEE